MEFGEVKCHPEGNDFSMLCFLSVFWTIDYVEIAVFIKVQKIRMRLRKLLILHIIDGAAGCRCFLVGYKIGI